MSNRVEAYVNDILRGIQEALETQARGADLIRIAREARQDQKLLKHIAKEIRGRQRNDG
jgi:hypothetical protein